jgi:hypothetical protein
MTIFLRARPPTQNRSTLPHFGRGLFTPRDSSPPQAPSRGAALSAPAAARPPVLPAITPASRTANSTGKHVTALGRAREAAAPCGNRIYASSLWSSAAGQSASSSADTCGAASRNRNTAHAFDALSRWPISSRASRSNAASWSGPTSTCTGTRPCRRRSRYASLRSPAPARAEGSPVPFPRADGAPASHPLHVPEQRPSVFQLARQALAIRRGDLELAERYRRDLGIVLDLDRRADLPACGIVLRV